MPRTYGRHRNDRHLESGVRTHYGAWGAAEKSNQVLSIREAVQLEEAERRTRAARYGASEPGAAAG
jgi:hypothetical protein